MQLKRSLQPLKNEIAKKEAVLKILYSLYPDLKGYSEAELLAYFDVQTIEALQRHIRNIQKPHVPHSENTQSQEQPVCACTDAEGYPKALYETEASAHKEISALRRDMKTKLSVYPCPNGCGWHLTKR